jgi:D-alanine-D-alanine ligase
MDKLTLKRLCGFHDIPQVGFVQAFTPGWEEEANRLDFPLWVKPSRLGSSVGISKVTDPADLVAAVEEAAKFDPRVIIEANSAGREIECSVLGNSDPEASLPGEILTDDEWYDYEAKYTEGRTNIAAPADLDQATTGRVRDLARQVFTLAGCSGFARCDFFVEESADGRSESRILVNEINTIPGFTRTSVYAKLWEATDLPYPDLCNRLVELALERHESESQHSF